jgi:Holliday junction DNA helicase RuvB
MNEHTDPQHRSDEDVESALRPQAFDDFTGQPKIVENLRIFIAAARGRGEPLDHVLLTGPPGLGKTTLSHIIAREMQAQIKITSGPVLEFIACRPWLKSTCTLPWKTSVSTS